MTGETVGQVRDRVLDTPAVPRSITVDHGTEFQSRALEDWAYRRGAGHQRSLRVDYNQRRPHSSLGHLTPNEFVAQCQGQPIVEAVVCSG